MSLQWYHSSFSTGDWQRKASFCPIVGSRLNKGSKWFIYFLFFFFPSHISHTHLPSSTPLTETKSLPSFLHAPLLWTVGDYNTSLPFSLLWFNLRFGPSFSISFLHTLFFIKLYVDCLAQTLISLNRFYPTYFCALVSIDHNDFQLIHVLSIGLLRPLTLI